MNHQSPILELKQDGVIWLASSKLHDNDADAFKRAASIKEVCEMLRCIPNVTIRDEYTRMIREQFKLRQKDMKQAFDELDKELRQKRVNKVSSSNGRSDDYTLPAEVLASGGNFDKYENSIVNYGVFSHTNVLYVIGDKQDAPPFYFKPTSNFSVEIINHMEDEKQPMRLVRIENQERARIFDTPFDSFLSKNSFKKMVEGFGNFQFFGSDSQYERLKSMLMDEMGDGQKIEVLGWQDDGFWCFNNAIVFQNEVLDLDKNGMIELDGVSYYVPSGNSIYSRNPTKFLNQKKVRLQHSEKEFKWMLEQGVTVHKERFYHAILFAIAGTFRDLIQDQLSFFPILFMYGAASTGKDNLVEYIQSLFGDPQEALVMTGRDNTAKAKIRELAQFQNMPAHFSEYKPEAETDDMIKKLWDGRGYKRGTIDHQFANETVPVRCPIIVTSNYYPTDDPVITRLVAMEFFETSFTQEQVDSYDLLKDVIKQGISGYLVPILSLRDSFNQDFRKTFKEVVAEFKSTSDTITMAPRMIQNVAVLGAAYKLAEGIIPFPFSYSEWKSYALDSLKAQERKRSSGSILQRFWDVLLELVRDKNDPITHEREFTITGDQLAIRYSQIYARYQQMHFRLHRENGLSKSVLVDALRKSDAFLEEKSTIRFGPDSRSSGLVFDLKKLHIQTDLIELKNYIFEADRKYGGADVRSKAAGDDQEDEDPSKDDMPF